MYGVSLASIMLQLYGYNLGKTNAGGTYKVRFIIAFIEAYISENNDKKNIECTD